MKSVDEVISNWSEEEREKLRDLIEESYEREKKLLESSKRNQENANEFSESITSLFSNLNELKETAERASGEVLDLYLRVSGATFVNTKN